MGNVSNQRDANEGEIVRVLLGAGCSVQRLHGCGKGVPDLLVGRDGFNLLLEVKVPGGKLNGAQVDWHREWAGQVTTVFSAEDALEACGFVPRSA
jgi:Holliday junction resolvase